MLKGKSFVILSYMGYSFKEVKEKALARILFRWLKENAANRNSYAGKIVLWKNNAKSDDFGDIQKDLDIYGITKKNWVGWTNET